MFTREAQNPDIYGEVHSEGDRPPSTQHAVPIELLGLQIGILIDILDPRALFTPYPPPSILNTKSGVLLQLVAHRIGPL